MTRRSLVVRLLVMSLLTMCVLAPVTAHASWAFYEERLTTHAADQRWPEISGDKVVFEDYRAQRDVGDENDPTTLYDIRVLDLNTMNSKDLTPYETAAARPAISGNNVVWEDYGHGTVKGGIYHHNLKTGVTKRLPISSGRELRISGNRVVFESYRSGGWHIYVYNVVTGYYKRLTPDGASAGAPDISGTKVVWQDFRDGNHEIYCYDIATGVEKRLTNNAESQTMPRISGDHVVWIDDRNGGINLDIYLYDLASNTEQQITSAPGNQWFPTVSGNIVAWQDERHGDTEIYLYDLGAGVEKRVTNNVGYQGNVSVSGNRIVWEDHLRSMPANMDIYLTEITPSRVTAWSPASIPSGGRAKVTGKLTNAAGTELPNMTVTLESSKDKATWTSVATTTTGPTGAYTLFSTSFTTRRYLRVRFAGDTAEPGGVSSAVLVKARLLFSSAPRFSTYTHRYCSTYKVWGYFRPEHGSGSTQIKVRAYRWNGSRWVYKRTYATKTSNPSGLSYTKYTGYVRLPSRGTWRVRAYHAEDTKNATSFSAYRTVKVK